LITGSWQTALASVDLPVPPIPLMVTVVPMVGVTSLVRIAVIISFSSLVRVI